MKGDFMIGIVCGTLAAMLVCLLASEVGKANRDARWCERIAEANLGVTLARCVDNDAKVQVVQ
jgi:hypothetical protein